MYRTNVFVHAGRPPLCIHGVDGILAEDFFSLSFSADVVQVARVSLDVDGFRFLSWLYFCSELSGFGVMPMYTRCRRNPGQIKFCIYPYSATVGHVARVTLDVDGFWFLSRFFFCSELSGSAVIPPYTRCRRDTSQIKFYMYP